ncbi:MAG: hypothetical protein A2V52_05175 [Actinobacteria bacterium RBG_19FT_COMBO_54_7]|uniref:Uncharacterized protein n=1 Tax=Candidatus Solincola sediminis TaxID=1797199 RepID=A0A1F2WPZ0_9ACTN|nr:MAG: hypothetical protein A2W01_03885 [Candidatus Solincola sediminis]OFW58934.1 MAG: hypothetical protein A2Y75_00125 [Candidatus Solincola sediminis]OFW70513.1 MAG: hypothetical protein A2V52_05175 [Actinobacteria bacterium RBG_19FT_COMBO_54_7]
MNGTTKPRAGRVGYRETLWMLRHFLVPMEPDPVFSKKLEELCHDLGGDEFLWSEWEPKAYTSGRKGMIIGGAIFSALPFMGAGAYFLGRYLVRRRVVPVGI